MRWLVRKIDALVGAFTAAVGALAGAQLPVFVQQYAQRLGGHVDEARRQLDQVSGAAAQALDPATRLALEALSRARLLALESQQQALDAVAPALRPVVFLRDFDAAIAAATLDRFQPALPLDTAGLAYGAAGLLVAWLLFEGFKLPLWLLWRFVAGRRRRAGTAV